MSNRLASSTSPYLQQHADNPVDWYSWGDEAFETARSLDKPVLLSVGYSACHWCHVMAHESFEDPNTAAVMNELFVNVKVDREERPDVDAIYMNAVQALTGRGGWPMTVWLTPDGLPFYAGTYYPPEDRHGMPSFGRVMAAVDDAWRNRREGVAEQAAALTAEIDRHVPAADDLPTMADLERAYLSLHASFDREHGGMGGAPKFPQEPTIEFLLRIADQPWAPEAKQMAFTTLDRMADGGIYDQVGGGFARYAVDGRWLIPHFEKMLYNNAQLARLYLRAWQMGGPNRFRTIATATLDYVLTDLTHPDGGWYSAEDADSEGVEGKFYVFSADEFDSIVGDGAPMAAAVFGVTSHGNFEGVNHLFRARTLESVAEQFSVPVAEVEETVRITRERLLEARNGRVRPGLDDKIIAAWNGLALRAFAEAGAILEDDRYLDAARANARFVLSALTVDGRLMRAWGKGKAEVPGFLDDHAGYAVGLFTLYMASGEIEWYEAAADLTRQILDRFADANGFHQTASDAEQLLTRPKDQMDNPLPSGSSLAAEALTWLGLFTGESELLEAADRVILDGGRLIEAYPSAVGHLLAVAFSRISGYREVAIVGGDPSDLVREVWSSFRPDLVLAVDRSGKDGEIVPLLAGRWTGSELAYVCRSFSCERPVGTAVELAALLG